MSADFSTEIDFQGTPEECAAVLALIRAYSDAISRDDFPVPEAPTKKGKRAPEMTLDGVEILRTTTGFTVDAVGPYGYGYPSDFDLFKAMAAAAPGAWFQARFGGFTNAEDIQCERELLDGLLYMTDMSLANEDYDWEKGAGEQNWNITKSIFDPVTKKYTAAP